MVINEENPAFGRMQNVKRRFFALRNGAVADVLRRAGSPYRIIFGLQLPEIVDVAAATQTDSGLAEALWANDTTRESRLMAPMVADRASFGIDDARRWMSGVCCVEEADILCHRLLRHLPFADELVGEFVGMRDGGLRRDLERYVGLRLARNLVYSNPQLALEAAIVEGERGCGLTSRLAAETTDEARFVMGE